MQLKLNCYQLKMDFWIYRMFFVSLVLTAKQRPRVDSLKIKKKDTEPNSLENQQFTKAGRNRKKKKQ